MRNIFSGVFEPRAERPSSLARHSYLGSPNETLAFYVAYARVMTSANYAAAKHAKWWHGVFIVVLLIVSFTVTVLPTLPASRWDYFEAVVTVLGAFTVSLAAVHFALDLDGKAFAHKQAAAEFSRIRRQMEIFALKPARSADEFVAELEVLLKEVSLCATLAPMVSEKLVRKYFRLYGDPSVPSSLRPDSPDPVVHLDTRMRE